MRAVHAFIDSSEVMIADTNKTSANHRWLATELPKNLGAARFKSPSKSNPISEYFLTIISTSVNLSPE
jgi:hypothetical protein